MSTDDAIVDVVTAEDPRLDYPSHHDWAWMDLGPQYGGWIDAAYPAINRLARERDEARARLERLESAVRVLGDQLYTLQDGLVWLREEAGKDVADASAAICSVVSMVSREGPKGLPGAAPKTT